MYKIDLLRHGETELSHTLRGSTDDALTALGWQQMHQTLDQFLATFSENEIWDVIFSSLLQRCRLFAEKISDQFDLDLYIDPNLQEMHFGDWEGVSTQKIYEHFPEQLAQFWQKPTEFTPPNAESIQAFHARTIEALKFIFKQMNNQNTKTALVVTHGGVIKLFKCLALQQPLDDILKMSAELGQLNSFILHEDLSLEYVEQPQ